MYIQLENPVQKKRHVTSSNSFWNVRTGAKTPESHTVPAQSNMQALQNIQNCNFCVFMDICIS